MKYNIKWKVKTSIEGTVMGFDEFESKDSLSKEDVLDMVDSECSIISPSDRNMRNMVDVILNATAGVSNFRIVSISSNVQIAKNKEDLE